MVSSPHVPTTRSDNQTVNINHECQHEKRNFLEPSQMPLPHIHYHVDLAISVPKVQKVEPVLIFKKKKKGQNNKDEQERKKRE